MSLQRLLAKLQSVCAQAFEKEGLTLTDDLCPAPLEKNFDKILLEQVVANFLTNALHHTLPGGNVTVTVTPEEVSVENEGRPIPVQELNRVWDRFYKIDKSRARAHNTGSGLGLTIAKNILILHKAEYGAENTKTGVKFWFRLPSPGIKNGGKRRFLFRRICADRRECILARTPHKTPPQSLRRQNKEWTGIRRLRLYHCL